MSGQHTPGPWSFVSSPYADGTPYFLINAGDGFHGDTNQGFGITGIMSEADARLIAAAPELFDALKAAREALADAVIEASGGMFDAATVGEHLVIAQIDAALTLAGDKE